jgi:signal peptidase I
MEQDWAPKTGPDDVDISQERYYGMGGFLWEVIKVFILALVIITPIRVFLFQPFFVEGASMEPNFKDGDYLIVNELGYKKTAVGTDSLTLFELNPFKSLERGDIVVFRYPKDETKFFIKRIVGLPGEKIKVSGGKVVVFNPEHPNGTVLDESDYLGKGFQTAKDVTVSIPEDEYFVMGDNRSFSFDSRDWGPLKKDEIIGKVMIRAWPLGETKIY